MRFSLRNLLWFVVVVVLVLLILMAIGIINIKDQFRTLDRERQREMEPLRHPQP
jgi:hypothetical protein